MISTRLKVSLSAALLPFTLMAQQAINTLSPEEQAQGFVLLFDGTLNKFKDNFVVYKSGGTLPTNWKVTNGSIGHDGTGPDIRTKNMYTDFDLRLEYRCGSTDGKGNEGIFYRFYTTGNYPWETGVEFAIDDNIDQSNKKLIAGAAYDIFPPNPLTYKVFSTGEWNTVRIVVIKDSVEHWMNGVKVVGFKYDSPTWKTAVANSKWSGYKTMFCKREQGNVNSPYIDKGYIGIQGDHGGPWQIRNLRLLDMSIPVDVRSSAHLRMPDKRHDKAVIVLQNPLLKLVPEGHDARRVIQVLPDGRQARLPSR